MASWQVRLSGHSMGGSMVGSMVGSVVGSGFDSVPYCHGLFLDYCHPVMVSRLQSRYNCAFADHSIGGHAACFFGAFIMVISYTMLVPSDIDSADFVRFCKLSGFDAAVVNGRLVSIRFGFAQSVDSARNLFGDIVGAFRYSLAWYPNLLDSGFDAGFGA